ncbi:hypothetical protein EZS27_028650 [termite gut metagenome]|uniref:Uncharacterized protein n=1 Tax=termite gut metagenome TaxID=433724 RepID=A0A5J4QLE8_9ZZZZ
MFICFLFISSLYLTNTTKKQENAFNYENSFPIFNLLFIP